MPGPIDSLASRGCNRLIADHLAGIVTSAAGLLTSDLPQDAFASRLLTQLGL